MNEHDETMSPEQMPEENTAQDLEQRQEATPEHSQADDLAQRQEEEREQADEEEAWQPNGDVYVYKLDNTLYINLTNRCTNACEFCERQYGDGVGPYRLWIEHEPEAAEVLAQFEGKGLRACKEVVFCGFGEPTMRLSVLLTVARAVKAIAPGIPVRLNTNGHANLINGGNITPRLKGLIDVVSISLNAPLAHEYTKICRPEFGEKAFAGLLDFAQKCTRYVPQVVFSVVDIIGEENIEKCRKIARECGARLRIRPYNEGNPGE